MSIAVTTFSEDVPVAQIPVKPGRKYVFLDGQSGRLELGTEAARRELLGLRPVPEEWLQRDLDSDLQGALQYVVEDLGPSARVVIVARWPESGGCNVLVEVPPDIDAAGRQW